MGSEVVLMTLETGECMGLGETGSSDVWRLLGEPIAAAGGGAERCVRSMRLRRG